MIEPIFPTLHLRVAAPVLIDTRPVRETALIAQAQGFACLPGGAEETFVHEEGQSVSRIDAIFDTQVVELLPQTCGGRMITGQHLVDETGGERRFADEAEWPGFENGAEPGPPGQKLGARE